MLFKNANQKVHVYAYDSTTGAAKTGDAANITAYVSLDGTPNAIDDTNPTEVDATNMPGVYVFDLTAAETNCDSWALYAKSVTANIRLEPIIGFTNRGAVPAIVAGADGGLPLGDADGRVRFQVGTNAGQLDTVSGAVKLAANQDVRTAGNVSGSVGSINGVTFPTNFSLLSIDANGYVAANLVQVEGFASTATALSNILVYYGLNEALPIGTNAPAGWINAAAIANAALNGKGDWNTTTPPTAAAIADAVLDEAATGHTGFLTTVLTSLGTNAPSGWINAAAIAANALNDKGNWATSAAELTPEQIAEISDAVVAATANPWSSNDVAGVKQALGVTTPVPAETGGYFPDWYHFDSTGQTNLVDAVEGVTTAMSSITNPDDVTIGGETIVVQ